MHAVAANSGSHGVFSSAMLCSMLQQKLHSEQWLTAGLLLLLVVVGAVVGAVVEVANMVIAVVRLLVKAVPCQPKMISRLG